LNPKKAKRKTGIWKLLFLCLLLLILYQSYPVQFKNFVRVFSSYFQSSVKNGGSFEWNRIANGIETGLFQARSSDNLLSSDIFLIRFNPNLLETRVIFPAQASSAAVIAQATGAIATINASFFDPQSRPLGLLIQGGKIIQRMPTAGMKNSGIFCIKYNRPYIFYRNTFELAGIQEAVQSIPRLIANGKSIRDIKDQNTKHRRSGIAIDYDGHIIIYALDTHVGGVSLKDLQKALLHPKLNIHSALNLDGGKSSQLYFKYGNQSKHIVGLVQVPVFLAFFEK